jgi:hypothetical protein
MHRILLGLLGILAGLLAPLSGVAFAQDSSPKNPEGGRQGGGDEIQFVRWQKSPETGAIYLAAWRALEPHLVDLGRHRLVDFDGSREKALDYFRGKKDVKIIVAFGREAAKVSREACPGVAVIEVSEYPEADVVLRVDRARLAILVKLLHARAKVALFGPIDEKLADLDTKWCHTAADAKGCDVAWVAEGGSLPEGVDLPVVSTAIDVPAMLTVRPDATDAGLKVASLIVGKLRDGKDLERQHVARTHVVVDLGITPDKSRDLDLRLLAHADAVRRTP